MTIGRPLRPRPFADAGKAAALAALALACAILPAHAPAQAIVPSTLVQAVPGAKSVALDGTLKGPNLGAREYVVRLEGGRTMRVELETKSPDTWFAVFGPYGEKIHSNEGDRRSAWSGRFPEPGEVRVRVYLGPESDRQARSAAYTLRIGVDAGH